MERWNFVAPRFQGAAIDPDNLLSIRWVAQVAALGYLCALAQEARPEWTRLESASGAAAHR